MRQIIFFVILICIAACNPVKQAFKPKHIGKTKIEFYSRGLCVNDTMHDTTIVHDSTVIKDTVTKVEFQLSTPEKFTLDTIIKGVKVKIANGIVSVQSSDKQKVTYQTKLITKVVRDLGLESTLRNTINAKDSVLVQTKHELADVTKNYYKYKFIVWTGLFILIFLVILRLYKVLKL